MYTKQKTNLGANNICIYFDEMPFTYISSFLFMPLFVLLLCFEVTDAIRVYDCYMDDGKLSKCFMRFYWAVTGYELLVTLFFTEVFAVTPKENVVMHTVPYLLLIYAFWTLSLKRFIYFRIVHTGEKWQQIGGTIYVIALFFSACSKALVIIPALAGYKLWQAEGWEWTQSLTIFNERLFTFLVVVCPLFVYYKIGFQLRSLTFTINRTKITRALTK